MPTKSGFDLDKMPEILQRMLYDELKEKFDGKRNRAKQSVTKEKKVEAAANIIHLLKGYTLPQKRAVLKFTTDMIEVANKRFARDPHGEGR